MLRERKYKRLRDIPTELSKWLKQPSSWLSLAATLISIFTFFLVYANPGSLEAYLPDQVGLGITNGGSLRMIVPITLTNTGAPRKHRHITRISALLRTSPQQPTSHAVRLHWAYENEFISAREYRRRYPDEPVASDYADYSVYLKRAFPFHLPGNSSATRVYELEQTEGRFPQQLANRFDLTVNVDTDCGTYSYSAAYSASGQLKTEGFLWAKRVQ